MLANHDHLTRTVARRLWLEFGEPAGRDDEFWRIAEAVIRDVECAVPIHLRAVEICARKNRRA